MAMQRGRLTPEDEQRIRLNYDFLMENLDPVDGILDRMITDGVIELLHGRDFVLNGGEKTKKGRCGRFLERLLQAGPGAYSLFIAGLRHENVSSDHIANKLEQTVVTIPTPTVRHPWIDELSSELRDRAPNDAECSRLSVALGTGWEHVMSELDITQVKVEQAKMSNHYQPANTISTLLIKWKQSKGSAAHFYHILNAIRAAEERCSVDWEKVEKVARKS